MDAWMQMDCYVPTEESDNMIKRNVYCHLDIIYGTVLRKTQNIILVDFDEKIGREHILRSTIEIDGPHGCSNDNDVRIISSQKYS